MCKTRCRVLCESECVPLPLWGGSAVQEITSTPSRVMRFFAGPGTLRRRKLAHLKRVQQRYTYLVSSTATIAESSKSERDASIQNEETTRTRLHNPSNSRSHHPLPRHIPTPLHHHERQRPQHGSLSRNDLRQVEDESWEEAVFEKGERGASGVDVFVEGGSERGGG